MKTRNVEYGVIYDVLVHNLHATKHEAKHALKEARKHQSTTALGHVVTWHKHNDLYDISD